MSVAFQSYKMISKSSNKNKKKLQQLPFKYKVIKWSLFQSNFAFLVIRLQNVIDIRAEFKLGRQSTKQFFSDWLKTV